MSQTDGALPPEYLALVRRELCRLHDAHVEALGKVLNDSLSVVQPNQRKTVKNCLELFTKKTVEELNRHLESVRQFLLDSLDNTQTKLTEKKIEELVNLVETIVQSDLYVGRFELFESSFARRVAAYGSPLRLSDFRPDLAKALLHAGSSNKVRAFSSEIRDTMLTVLERQRNTRPVTDRPQEQLVDKINKAIKLEPNFFGIGLNLNYLIRLLRRKE